MNVPECEACGYAEADGKANGGNRGFETIESEPDP